MAILKIFENRLPLYEQILVTEDDKLLHGIIKKVRRLSFGPMHYILSQTYPSTARAAVLKNRFYRIFRKSRFFSRNDDVTRAWRFNILERDRASRLLPTIVFQMLARFRPNCIWFMP